MLQGGMWWWRWWCAWGEGDVDVRLPTGGFECSVDVGTRLYTEDRCEEGAVADLGGLCFVPEPELTFSVAG